MTTMHNPHYTAPDHTARQPQAHTSTFVHTPFPQHPHMHSLYPIMYHQEMGIPLPHNPIAAAAAAQAAANATYARIQHRPFHEVKRRRRLTPDETRRLTYVFLNHTTKPDAALRQQLAEELNMTARAVQVWFQNRRAKSKREQETIEHNDLTGPLPQPESREQQEMHDMMQSMKEEELQAIESMLNLENMMDNDDYIMIKQEPEIPSNRNVYNLSVHIGIKDNLSTQTTLTPGIERDDAFHLYNSCLVHEPSPHSSPLSNTNSSLSEDPSIASMAEMMSNALSELIIPFPGSPYSYSASPCTLPLTPGQDVDMLDLLRLPTPLPKKTRPLAPRSNSTSNTCYTPLVPSPMNSTPHRHARKSRSVANSPYHCSPSRELVWVSNITPKEIERSRKTPILQDVRRIQSASSARRYSWSVGECE